MLVFIYTMVIAIPHVQPQLIQTMVNVYPVQLDV